VAEADTGMKVLYEPETPPEVEYEIPLPKA
jgi:hypothetical protein